ncbi:MAG: hypothetical protein E6K68_05625 [Nitrospirae bacterium]|nr:MAG: hypothetical protein E6K68_05625 [Nitrospirota bacterium]
MQDWSRPDPLTRDLIHLINARRHDHWDVDAALDTLTELIQQGREEEILTVLAALDEDMAEWLFDLVAEAASTTVWGEGEEETQGGSLLTIALPLQASFEQPLRLTVNQEETAALLRRYLHLSQESHVVVEPKLLTDTTLERLSLQGLYAHVETVFNGTRSRPVAARLHTPMEHTVYLMFGVREEGEPTLPQELGPEEQEGVLQGLRAQCGDLAPAPHLLEAPVYAAYALFDAKNSVGLQRLADETIAVWRELTPTVRGRVIVHLHTQCGNGVYMPVWTDLLDPGVGEEAGPIWTSPDVWVFTADLPIEWPGEVLTNRLLAEGCTRFENHIVEAPDN